jgi:hypothetical protein
MTTTSSRPADPTLAARALSGVPSFEGLLSAALPFVVVLTLGFAHAGYSPPAWGWSALALLSTAILALLLSNRVSVSIAEAAFVSVLTGFLVWMLVSLLWSVSATDPLAESQRTAVYVAAALATSVVLRRRFYRHPLFAVWAATSLVCVYSLSTRLFPGRFGIFDRIAGGRLSEPIGYWNGLGIFAALGALLALGIVARASSLVARVLAGVSLVILVPTLYFTFSRGAWIALGAGLVTIVLLDPRRLQLVAALLVVGPWPALAVLTAYNAETLTRLQAAVPAASADGRRVALVLALLLVASAAATISFALVEHRVRPGRRLRAAFGIALVLVLAGALAATFVRFGSPPTLVRRAYDAFTAPQTVVRSDLNERLFSLSAGQRIPQWRVAWDDYRSHRWLGSGAGSYERTWARFRPNPGTVRNAHSLYLETLAELGPVGLAMLVVALAIPLGAAVRARWRSLAPAAAGAYVAFLVHAAGDWDWQLPAISLAALFCASALLAAARASRTRRVDSVRARLVAGVLSVVIAGFAFVGLVGNSAVAASTDALDELDLARAEAQARKAAQWMPWSSLPWERLAQAQLFRGERGAGLASLRKAIAKDRDNWRLWYELALASSGPTQRHALREARRLAPLEPQVVSLSSELASTGARG